MKENDRERSDMAMTHKSLLNQYKASVKAIDFFKEKNSTEPTREIDMIIRDSILPEVMLRSEINRRGLVLPTSESVHGGK